MLIRTQRSPKTIFNALLLFLGLILYITLLLQSSQNFPHDLLINLKGIESLRQSGILYDWTPTSSHPLYYSFISSPAVAVLLYPLTFLDQNIAVFVYRLLSVALYILAIVLLSRIYHLTLNAEKVISGWVWLVMLLWLPTQDSFSLGQINEIILLCLILAYWGWITNQDIPAGIGVGLAAALKITPILLVLLFVFSGRWRAALTAIIVAAALGGMSCGIIGVNQCVAFGTTISPNISRGSADYYHIGFNGLWYRALTAGQTNYWTNLNPPPDTLLSRVVPLVELFIFIVAGYFITRHSLKKEGAKPALFVLWIAGMLLSAPITWWHYSIWLLMGIPMLIEFAVLSRSQVRWRIGLGIVLINISPYFLLGIGVLSGSHFLTYVLLILPCCGLFILTVVFYRLSQNSSTARTS